MYANDGEALYPAKNPTPAANTPDAPARDSRVLVVTPVDLTADVTREVRLGTVASAQDDIMVRSQEAKGMSPLTNDTKGRLR